MPASDSLVTLDHAKDWAKRLSKHQSGPLAQSQEAVAVMLGHASWHALQRFYQNLASPPETSSQAILEDADAWMKAKLDQVNQAFPGLDAVELEALAHNTTECEVDAEELYYEMRQLEDEGYMPEVALGKALEERSVEVLPPPGHLFLRVRTADGRAFLVPSKSEKPTAKPAGRKPAR